MKGKHKVVLMLWILVLLTGCRSSQYMSQEAMLRDDQVIESPAITGYGINTEGKLGEDGLYFPYEGGEMTLDLFLRGDGYRESGVTMLLFLDGQPQPYRMEEGNTAYMHTLYPKNSADCSFPISFTPVTGEAGDMLELCILYLPAYGYRMEDGTLPWYEESNAMFFMTRIKLMQTPENHGYREVKDRLLDWDVSREAKHLPGWQEGQVSCSVYCSSVGQTAIGGRVDGAYRWMALDTVTFDLVGDPAEERTLIVYMDREPVLVEGKAPTVSPAENQRTYCTMKIDCSDCETMVFALVLQRDYHGDGAGWADYPDSSSFRVLHMENVA